MSNIKNNEVKVYLLGKPKIIMNKKEIFLPYKKVEAIFYYIIVEKEASKLKLADIFWGDKYNEEKCMKSLRNAIYVIRKTFGKDFFAVSTQNTVKINLNYSISNDVYDLFNGVSDVCEIYKGEFLENFYLKNCDIYDDWIEQSRQRIRIYVIDKLINKAQKYICEDNFIDGERLCLKLINIDEFDERGYRLLIDLYKRKKMYSKVMKVYNKLERLLMEELLISPNDDIKKIVQEAKNERNKEIKDITNIKIDNYEHNKKKKTTFYGRKEEKHKLIQSINSFSNNEFSNSPILLGEEGIGKTRLAEEILNIVTKDNILDIFKTQCYRAEERYMLKPWQSIFSQIMNKVEANKMDIPNKLINSIVSIFPFLKPDTISESYDFDSLICPKYETVEKSIVNLLLTISKKKKLIIFFDDIQWADEVSISLIRNILTTDKNKSIFFIFTCRLEKNKYIETFIFDMNKNGFLYKVMIKRFSIQETADMAEKLMPEFKFSDKTKKILFSETEGNPFFIIEILNNIKDNGSLKEITPNIRNVLENRIMSIHIEARKVLDIMAIFFDKITFDFLSKVSNINGYELVENIETLINKNIINEKGNINDTYYVFSHQKIREYVYSEMTLAKKRILHKRVAQIFENQLQNNNKDTLLYSKLIYHYEKCGDINKSLRYTIKYLYGYLCVAHEFFPVIENPNYQNYYKSMSFSIENIEHNFKKISVWIDENLKRNYSEHDVELISEYLHMLGRFYIRKGEYKTGLKYINELKKINKPFSKENNLYNIIKANRQLMCIHINTYNTNKMNKVIEESLLIVNRIGKTEDIAIWYRLDGLKEIMSGRTREGEKELNKAIEIFENSLEKRKYLVNLAASYGWIGEAKRLNMEYDKAIKYLNIAIKICEGKGLLGGLPVFYANAGQAAYEMENYILAEEYLKKSIEYYKQADSLWGRALAYSYYSLILLIKKEYEESLKYLEKAKEYAVKLKSPYEQGVVFRIFAQIRNLFSTNNNIKCVFLNLIDKNVIHYKEKVKEIHQSVYSPVDRQYIDKI